MDNNELHLEESIFDSSNQSVVIEVVFANDNSMSPTLGGCCSSCCTCAASTS